MSSGERWALRCEAAAEEATNGLPRPAAASADSSAGRLKELREEIKKLPLVQKARDVLGADIVGCDPDFGTAVATPKDVSDETEDD